MPVIRTELLRDGGDPIRLGSVSPDTLLGSLHSDEAGKGRRVFLFGWHEGRPGVWESHGVDSETPPEQGGERHVIGILTPLSDLGSPYELTVYRRGAKLGTVRFRLTDEENE